VGWVKINTDGARKEDGRAGCGGILRGSEGEWHGGFSKYVRMCSAYVAELCGVYEGLQYARRLWFILVELNVDSLVVAKTLLDEGDVRPISRNLVQKIRRLLQMAWEVKVQHSYREANTCADALTNIGCSMGSTLMIYESCQTQLRHLLVADQMGVPHPRMVNL